MSKSNPQIVLDSFALTKSFQLGPVVKNTLVPDSFTKSQHFYLKTWREQSVSNGSWGSTWNWLTPESLNVVSSHFLEIPLPAIGGGSYKSIPGLYAIRGIKLLSNGSEVYDLDYRAYLREFMSSLSDEELRQFVDCYMGGTVANGAGRTICCPLPLPNSHYLRRHWHKSFGIFPHKTRARIEFQIHMGTAEEMAAQGSEAPATIANLAQIVTREVKGDQNAVTRKYSDARGVYTVMVPRFQVVVDWKALNANTSDKVKAVLPTGSCYEFICEAYPSTHSLVETERNTAILPIHYSIECDGELVRVLDSELRVKQELFSNGYRSNDTVNNAARICFADQTSNSDTCFRGALNCANVSAIQTDVTFAENVRYRILAKKYSKVRIESTGVMRTSFDG